MSELVGVLVIDAAWLIGGGYALLVVVGGLCGLLGRVGE